MAKPKNNQIPIFWIVVSVILVWIGIDNIKDMIKYDPTHTSLLVLPIFMLVFGGMILGVVVNKISNLEKAKSGKAKNK